MAIRQLVPLVGNSVVITSQVIGVFLLFLALGYYRGGQHKQQLANILRTNLTLATVLLGFGLSAGLLMLFFVNFYNQLIQNSLPLLWIYLLVIIAPLSYFLGQTLPLTLNLLPKANSRGQQAGYVLALSTVGSFLGAVFTTLVLMNWLGVALTIFINSALLTLLTLLLVRNAKQLFTQLVIMAFLLGFIFVANVTAEKHLFTRTTAYANYQIIDTNHSKELIINNSPSSVLHKNNTGFAYIELIKHILFQQLAYRDKDILVLGAGGFTLSAQSTYGNHFTYIDIDKQLPNIVKPRFIKFINGRFKAADARVFILHSKKKYNAIVTDTFSNLTSIPSYLLTANFLVKSKSIC